MSYYGYCLNVTKQEKLEIDEKTKNSREEFRKGFVKAVSFSLAVYTAYSLTKSAAYATDGNVPANPNVPATTPKDTGAVQPAPNSRSGMQPLSDGSKGAFVAGASGVCAVALQTGDYVLGDACGLLVVVAVLIMNRS